MGSCFLFVTFNSPISFTQPLSDIPNGIFLIRELTENCNKGRSFGPIAYFIPA